MKVTLAALALHGGIVHYSVSLANALAEHLPVRVVVPKGAETGGYNSAVEVREIRLPMECSLREAARAPGHLAALPQFTRALRGPQSDLVHYLNRHEYLTAAAPLLSRRLVVTLHDPHPHRGEASPRKLLANWALRRYARRIFVFGNLLKEHVVAQGVPAERVHVVPHGSFGEFARPCDLPRDEAPIGLFFGRILPYKGLEVLLRAAPLIRQQVPSFRLVVAGEGDVTPYRHLLDAELATGQCTLLNRYIPDEEMAELLSSCTAVLLPYLEATQSGVIPLAYGAQRPVVATAVGALPEIVADGETGLLVPPGDATALAEAACRVLSEYEFAAGLAAAGRRYAEEHLSWEAIARTTVAVYREVAEGGG